MDWRRPVLSVLWPDGNDLQCGQHHDAGCHGSGEVSGNGKPTQIRYWHFMIYDNVSQKWKIQSGNMLLIQKNSKWQKQWKTDSGTSYRVVGFYKFFALLSKNMLLYEFIFLLFIIFELILMKTHHFLFYFCKIILQLTSAGPATRNFFFYFGDFFNSLFKYIWSKTIKWQKISANW